jgi:hypothetical protein
MRGARAKGCGRFGARICACLAGAVLFSTPALATPSARLTYSRSEGAESCPDEGVLRRAVEQRLGYDPFFPWADRTIVARLSGEARELHASIELLDAGGIVRGSRKLTAPASACRELVSGMALAISIAIDPSSVDRPPAPGKENTGDPSVEEWSEARASEAAAAPVPDRASSHAAAPPAPNRDRANVVVSVDGGVTGAVGLAPAAALGPMLGARLTWPSWELGIDGHYLFGFDKSYPTGHVSSSVLDGTLVGCFRPGAVFACGVASAGRLGVSGSGITQPKDAAAFVFGLGARAGVEIPLSAVWSIDMYADLMFNLTEQSVELGGGEVWPSNLVGGLATVAARRRFP